MNRREFLLRSSLFTAGGLLARSRIMAQSQPASPTPPATALAAQPAPAAFEFKPLRRGVGLFTGRGGTIGWLSTKDALLVIDTQFPDTAAVCLEGLPDRNRRTIDVVINTHHHSDHTGGNGVFKPVAKTIVAHANVPKLQFAAAERAERDPKAQSWARLDQQVYADRTFPDFWRRELGDEIVNAQYHGPAHTSGDVAIFFEKANVVHMGDLMFNRLYPVIDRASGASARGWISALEDAAKTYPKDAIYIFGHGNARFGVTGQHSDLFVLRDYWSAVLDHVQKQIAAGKKKDEVVTLENLPGFPDFHQPLPNRLGGNLAAVWDELTEKKA